MTTSYGEIKMTKKELIKALGPIDDDTVVVCEDENGGWDNIQRVERNSIIFGGGSPFTDDK